MKRLRTVFFVCLTAVLSAFALTGCTSSQEQGIPQTSTPSISTPAIANDGVLRVGVNAQNAPFAYQNSNKVVGLDVDVAASVADQLGLKLELVDVGSDPTSALDDGSADVVMDIDSNGANLNDYWVSDPYIQSAPALFATTQNGDPNNPGDQSIAVQTNSYASTLVSNQYGSNVLSYSNDIADAFQELSDGNVQYVACDAVIGTYINYTKNSGAHIVSLLEDDSGYSFACAKDNTDLSNAIKDALSTIQSNGVMSVLQNKWFGTDIDLSSIHVIEGNGSPRMTGSQKNNSSTISAVGSNAANLQNDTDTSTTQTTPTTNTQQGYGATQNTPSTTAQTGTGTGTGAYTGAQASTGTGTTTTTSPQSSTTTR